MTMVMRKYVVMQLRPRQQVLSGPIDEADALGKARELNGQHEDHAYTVVLFDPIDELFSRPREVSVGDRHVTAVML